MDGLRNALRLVYMAAAAVMVFAGIFWALQGLGIIMWPADSFMLADRKWTLYGLLWASGWSGLIWVLRGRGGTGE